MWIDGSSPGRWAFLLLALTLAPCAVWAQADRLVPFSIEDQFKQVHTASELAGQAVALVWYDRSSRDAGAVWADSLTAVFARSLPTDRWQVRLAAHTKGAPFFVKGKIRGSFSKDPERWALLDWKGTLREAYDPPPDRVTVMVFTPDGRLAAKRSVLAFDSRVAVELARTAVAALAPAESPPAPRDFPLLLAAAARERTRHHVVYDGSYRGIGYPGGDVPDSLGVCSDVVIRAYRALGVDLQRRVHEDMLAAFAAYPDRWGLSGPDPNIDHRRVPNLQVFFTRHGVSLPETDHADDYQAGDIVTWLLPGDLPHIGIVVDERSTDGRRPLIVHNIGRGPRMEDVLFRYPVTGHYRYDGSR